MTPLENKKGPGKLPNGVVLEKLPFVPRMVMTSELKSVGREVMDQWRNRKAFEGLAKYGIRPLDRLLFFGPPGNGKTMACYWIAKQLDIPLYRVLCEQLHQPYLGQTTNAIADVVNFFSAREEPALCLWDEVEAIFMDRNKSRGGAEREISTATTIFLQALDRWKSPTLIVMATNLPERLDAALLSRVELRLHFPGPDLSQCEQMVEYWAELLHANGGADWGPVIAERIKGKLPESFRELQQTIAFAAREWTAQRFCKGN